MMLLKLNHKNLFAYAAASELLKECYTLCEKLPGGESFNLVRQIKRAALSVKLNIAEGSSRRSLPERKRFYEIARGSLIEIDAAIESCVDLKYVVDPDIINLGSALNSCFASLSGLIAKA